MGIGLTGLEHELAEFIGDIDPTKALFWTGAGVSANPPTCLPLGTELTKRVMCLFEDGALGTLQRAYEFLDIHDSTGSLRKYPRLEFVLGIAEQVYGERAFDAMSGFNSAVPNPLHTFYADHLKRGGSHITANFDTCIERATPSRGFASVLHLHGTVDSIEEIGATVARIQHGFTEDTHAAIQAALDQAHLLIVVGYSGSDFFDVDPALRRLSASGLLRGLKVLWIRHGAGAPALRPIATHDRIPMQRLLAQGGADVQIAEGDPYWPHRVLGKEWGIDITDPRPCTPAPPSSAAEPEEAERDAASVLLWHETGHTRALQPYLAVPLPPLPIPEEDVRAYAAWSTGRYGDARRLWRHLPGSSPQVQLRRLERSAACLWAQGRLIPAYIQAHRAATLAQEDKTLDPSEVAETLYRIVDHMSRTPDLGLVGRFLKRSAAARLVVPDLSHSIHMRSRLLDVSRIEAGGDPEGLKEIRASFVEVESLNAFLDYRHRELRDSNPKTGNRRTAILDLVSKREHIGNHAGIARAVMLPGATMAFSFWEAVRMTRGTQFGYWHRIRMIAFWIRDLFGQRA